MSGNHSFLAPVAITFSIQLLKGSFDDVKNIDIEIIIEDIMIAKGVFKFFISNIIAIDN